MMDTSTLAVVWYGILALSFFLYVLLDGFDLGVGILTLFTRDEQIHTEAVESISGVWHANQTWIIVFGASLFGAFPAAYGLVLSALYIPVALMLLGFVFRGIGLEYYYEVSGAKVWAGKAFGWGSLVASVAQGLGVGAWLAGLALENGQMTGGVWTWVGLFSLLIGAGLPIFYTLLGAARLAGRSRGRVREFASGLALRAAWPAILAAVAIVVWALAVRPFWARSWFEWPGFIVTLLPLLLGAALLLPLIQTLKKEKTEPAFFLASLVVGLMFAGVACGVFPCVIPPGMTIFDAASPSATLSFMLVGVGVFFPVILIYSLYMYRVFGKQAQGEVRSR